MKELNVQKIAVIGLGRIGLPTAVMFASKGFEVIGVDINEEVINAIKQRHAHFIEPGLDAMMATTIKSRNFREANKPEEADGFIICVPTPFKNNHKVDLSFVRKALEDIFPVLRKGNIVVLESTVPPGTTLRFVVPLLEKSGLQVREDLYVGYCAERVLPGNILVEIVKNDRVIGGQNKKSAEKIRDLYSSFVQGKIYLTDTTTAEMTKLIENTYRDVNIAFANELALLCEKIGVNAWEVIELANRHPRVNILKPGPGVGGHCIAVDPWFLIELFPQHAQLIETARLINQNRPNLVVKKVLRVLQKANIEGRYKVTILGVAYKANVDDTRETPALKVIAQLMGKGCSVSIYDPLVKEFSYPLEGNLSDAVLGSDCLVIITDHDEFKSLNPYMVKSLVRSRNILDARNCVEADVWKRAGFNVVIMGGGSGNNE